MSGDVGGSGFAALGGSPILIVDNRDSFVFNLVRYLKELGAPVCVREAEALDEAAVAALQPAGILLSPGPKRPGDAVMCKRIVARFAGVMPILGVCLGHQVIAETFGGIVREGEEPVHGKNTDILHDGAGVFTGLPTPFSATRYHSLVVEASSLPACLQVTARTPDGVVMGIRHREHWVEGVQFHPEAALSEQGHALLANFLRACGLEPRMRDGLCDGKASHVPGTIDDDRTSHMSDALPDRWALGHVPNRLRQISGVSRQIIPLIGPKDAQQVFSCVQTRIGSVFLDSAKHHPETGAASMVAWSPWMSVSACDGNGFQIHSGSSTETCIAGSVVRDYTVDGRLVAERHSSRDVLDEVRFRLQLGNGEKAESSGNSCDLPDGHTDGFNRGYADGFAGGYADGFSGGYADGDTEGFYGGAIGMLAYEAWDPARWLPGGTMDEKVEIAAASTNDAWFWFHRFVLYVEHRSNAAYLVATIPEDEREAEWLLREATALVSGTAVSQMTVAEEPDALKPVAAFSGAEPSCDCTCRDQVDPPHPGVFASNFDEPAYHGAIERMRAYIRSGDIYIANMTRQIHSATDMSGPELHRRLRTGNPAVFSAYFPYSDRELVSASPERFLRIRNGWVETKPIKGTRPRGLTPKEDEANRLELEQSAKDRAELLMITDLERNDLSRVCDPGTVAATALFELESLPTVFHLVSTVKGRLSPANDAIDCLRACFPGGSITGAPKLRAMEVIRELEGIPRGPYTGCLGWIGYNGDADFSILIRTFVKQGSSVRFGVGGGITWDSDPAAEWRETCDKARALVEALGGDCDH